jgi:FkbM family methyltransferase
MGIVSYAQNFEDVMLWRALKDVENGFYIDIGANDPVEYSVTKAMYDLGWHGLNIEPVPYWFNKLEETRTRDININIAIGKQEDTLEFYEVLGSGLSTLDKNIALSHVEKFGFEVEKYTVPVQPLTTVCKEKK